MSVNKNIMKKIMDNVALNEWKNKVKKINGEYYRIYIYLFDNLRLNIENSCNHVISSHYDLYHFKYRPDNQIFHHNICKCILCNGIYIKTIHDVYILPKNYDYTSGMDDPNGYKKIE